jgi:Fe-S cluster assembly protein SufD
VSKERYLEDFESFEKKEASRKAPWFRPIRRRALSRFAELGFPTPHDEDWKYTNVTPLVKNPFHFVSESAAGEVPLEKIQPFLFGASSGPRLVFVNGLYSKELSQIPKLPQGFRVASLRETLNTHADAAEPYLARTAPYEKNGFTALNTAFVHDGAFVYLPKDGVLEEAIHLLFVSFSSEKDTASNLRNLVILEKGSKATLIESYLSLSKSSYFTNAVTEIVLGEGARLDSYKIQREDSENGFHVATTEVRGEQNSTFSSFSFSLGAKLARENLHVLLAAVGCECTLNGLYLVSDGQHVDHHTVIDHLKPHGTSRQLYKGILNGRSRAVFNGKIFVREDAAKSDAEQINKNLLLSDEATVDAKPQLEISNDDVKCTHGEAVGQLDEEQIFYLKTRGVDDPGARGILTYGFASEVINRIGIAPIRSGLDQLLWAWLRKKASCEVPV